VIVGLWKKGKNVGRAGREFHDAIEKGLAVERKKDRGEGLENPKEISSNGSTSTERKNLFLGKTTGNRTKQYWERRTKKIRGRRVSGEGSCK